MSKLQKKKTPGEKKKRKVDSEGVSASGSVSSVATKSRSASESRSADKVDQSVGSAGLFSRVSEFVREVKVELKKVTWPTKKQTTGTTVVVLFFVFIVSIFLGVFDYGLSKLVQMVLT